MSISCLASLLASTCLPIAKAYNISGDRWPSNTGLVMYLQLNEKGSLIDGSTSFNTVAETALALWNPYIGSNVQFKLRRCHGCGRGRRR